jgi:uridine kinase
MNARVNTHRVSPMLVGIGGGTGKSSLAQALVTILGPAQTVLVSHHAYYRDGGAPPVDARASVNYAVPDAFDRTLFLEHLGALRAGHPVRPPTYCLVTHRRTGQAAVVVPRAIVLIEGVLLLWEPAVRAALDLKIYLDEPARAALDRRLVRYLIERDRTSDRELGHVTTPARDAHRDFVEPTRAMADLVLSTAGQIQPLAEIAAAVILDRLARHRGHRAHIAS